MLPACEKAPCNMQIAKTHICLYKQFDLFAIVSIFAGTKVDSFAVFNIFTGM